MRMYPKEFPSGRRRNPKRRAERQVYEALAGSDRQGFVYYEWRRDRQRPELDFAIWIAGLGRIALQVKGGHYLLIDGEWHLKTRDGVDPIKTSPLDEVWLQALDLHDDIEEKGGSPYNPFVVPVVAFTDMEPDDAIEKLAGRKEVYLVWRTDDLVADLAAIMGSRRVVDRLSMERIAREVLAVTDGLIHLAEAVNEESRRRKRRPITLSLTVGGIDLIRFSAREIHLRFGPFSDPGASRKKSESGRP